MIEDTALLHFENEGDSLNPFGISMIVYQEITDKSDHEFTETKYRFYPDGTVTADVFEVTHSEENIDGSCTETRSSRCVGRREYRISGADMICLYRRIGECARNITGSPLSSHSVRGIVKIIYQYDQVERISRYAYSNKECIYDPIFDVICKLDGEIPVPR